MVARLVASVAPEQLGPSVGSEVRDWDQAFGVREPPSTPWSRVDGHLFVLIEARGSLAEPDRVEVVVGDRAPSETAFVLTRNGDAWRYAGVGRWRDGSWEIPCVDYPTWRNLGQGRSASRRLEHRFVSAAAALADRLEAQFESGAWLDARGRKCRFSGRAPRGGVRVDGGPDGWKTRTVSLTDLAWVLAAEASVAKVGGVLDEIRVNQLRYLDGTPKSSTRWIDTQWALTLVEASRIHG